MPHLIVVPTPIGNLKDITLRALETLKEATVIFAEDTRTSANLLRHYEIESKKILPFHLHNEHKVLEQYINLIKEHQQAVLVSDAGTPGISDPGFLLIRACLQNNITIECLPGATALIPALVTSGFPTDRFIFEGFLPPKKGRVKRIEHWKEEEKTIILYESPHKLLKTLQQLSEIIGKERLISIVRELTKKFEENFRGTIEEAIHHFTAHEPRGEFVLIIKGNNKCQNEED
ncbi:MAG: 16S rRNA (cytidine(1402)-2'-O)-methyltransferase [Bacteroidia bacterium]|nr:16S rRNA (cytidine(1402)-2'-O)-methyltransferase [Bacteroidia bacterium]